MNDKQWEFSKKLTFFFACMFFVHLASLLVSAMFRFGDYQLIKDSFIGSLSFYSVAFALYMGKTTFENYDKHKNIQKELDREDAGSNG